jgi:hypothetical protein
MLTRRSDLGVATREAAGSVAHIDALLDLSDERSPGSQPDGASPGPSFEPPPLLRL